MTFRDPEVVSLQSSEPSRVRGRSPIRTSDRREAPKTLVEKLARVGLAFDRHGRIVICKPDQEVHIADHG